MFIVYIKRSPSIIDLTFCFQIYIKYSYNKNIVFIVLETFYF